MTNLFFFNLAFIAFWKRALHIFIIYYYICLPLCAHILYFDAAKFSIKLVSLVDFSDSVVRQRDEYEIVTETRPISRC